MDGGTGQSGAAKRRTSKGGKGGIGRKTQPRSLEAASWHRQAVELRTQGRTYVQIAEALQVSTSAAHKAVADYLEQTRAVSREAAEEVRRLELDRLDRVLAVVGPMAEGGDLQAVDRLLRIQERRASLLGLDAPRAQLVAVDSRPDTVRALMAIVQNSNSGGAQDNGSSVLDAARDVTPAHTVTAADSVRKPNA
jgi:hypothetical protein